MSPIGVLLPIRTAIYWSTIVYSYCLSWLLTSTASGIHIFPITTRLGSLSWLSINANDFIKRFICRYNSMILRQFNGVVLLIAEIIKFFFCNFHENYSFFSRNIFALNGLFNSDVWSKYKVNSLTTVMNSITDYYYDSCKKILHTHFDYKWYLHMSATPICSRNILVITLCYLFQVSGCCLLHYLRLKLRTSSKQYFA